MSQEPLNSNNSLESEELSEEDLDAIAGGQALPPLSDNLLPQDNNKLLVDHCNMEASRFGTRGTVEPVIEGSKAMNMTLSFP